jgi:hypothetical protein
VAARCSKLLIRTRLGDGPLGIYPPPSEAGGNDDCTIRLLTDSSVGVAARNRLSEAPWLKLFMNKSCSYECSHYDKSNGDHLRRINPKATFAILMKSTPNQLFGRENFLAFKASGFPRFFSSPLNRSVLSKKLTIYRPLEKLIIPN